MDIRRLKKLIKELPKRNETNGYKYLVVANEERKQELLALVAKLPKEERNDVIVCTEAENSAGGMGVRSSGHLGRNRTNGWESSTFDYAAKNGEID